MKAALITGAAKGIVPACAEAFVAGGWGAVLVTCGLAGLESTCREPGDDAPAPPGDLTEVIDPPRNPDRAPEEHQRTQLLGRLATPSECAVAPLFLASLSAFFISGVALPVVKGSRRHEPG